MWILKAHQPQEVGACSRRKSQILFWTLDVDVLVGRPDGQVWQHAEHPPEPGERWEIVPLISGWAWRAGSSSLGCDSSLHKEAPHSGVSQLPTPALLG